MPLARVEGHWPADLPPAPVDAPRVGRYIVDVRSFEMLALPELESATAASFFKQKTAYEIMSGDWSSDVCSSD
eukprot:COSAG02_NODE_32594_length_514_cov_0.491566_1_plen_72_part_10